MRPSRLLAFLLLLGPATALAAPHSPRWRGVVEGFNDTPWTHAQRLDAIRWMGAHGMNIYIYAPKRDPFHRERWREPYPVAEVKRFAELVRAGRKAGVDVVAAISPGLSMHYSRSEDVLALEDKIDALNAAGVQHFAVFLDDIPWNLQFDDDKAKYPDLGTAQADVLDQVIGHLRYRGIEGPYITVGTQYYDLKETPYKRAWREHLDKAWDVMWTGDGGPKRATITPTTVRAWTRLWGRKPFIWDNYPVNDYNKDRLFFAPVVQRGDIGGLVSGYAFNPLTQPTLARLTLCTGADYLRNTAAYKPWASWKLAKDELFGKSSRARSLMDAIVELNTARPFGPQGSPEMLAAVEQALTPGARAAGIKHLRSVFSLCANAEVRMPGVRTALPRPEICEEMAPWLPAISRAGTIGLQALDAIAHPSAITGRRLQQAWDAAQTGRRVAPEPLGQLVRGAVP